MKNKSVALVFLVAVVAVMGWGSRAEAIPVNCIVCGNTALTGANVDGTISFAVISGTDFLSEIAFHSIGFSGLVPGGSLDAVPNSTAPTDFVYLYQLVNTGPNASNISDYTVSRGSATLLTDITGGGRLESTIFLDPVLGIVSAGPSGATTALSAGVTVDFLNGLGDPIGPAFGPCLGSGGSFDCSDATANLLATSIQGINFGETPSAPLLDPLWSSSIMWYSTPIAPGSGLASISGGQTSATGNVVVPGAIPEPTSLALLGLGLAGLGFMRRRSAER